MDNRNDELWQGGSWEQPAHPLVQPPTISIPIRNVPRPVLRTRKRPRSRWKGFLALFGLVAGLCLLTVFLGSLSQDDPVFTIPELPGDWQPSQMQEYSTDPPDIPQAKTGTGVELLLNDAQGESLSFTQIYEQNAACMVSIQAESVDEYSTGTGIILTQDGYIVTNAHVVAGAQDVQVSFSNNNVLTASLVGFDADEDLAVLKVEATGLTPARFGDSSALRCGDPVAAIGDPLGYRSTITDGIVSALDREVEVDNVTMVLIQTSAAINFGNSGGALINQYGQVVGITTIKIVTEDGSAEALGFAIPSQRVKYVVDTLIDGKEIRPGVFGFTVITRPIPGGGLKLESVDPRSDAFAKGIQAGDIILAADGQSITSSQDLARLKLSRGPGDLVTLVLSRDGTTYTVEVALIDPEQMD